MIKIKSGLTVWICEESHCIPNKWRSIDSACTIQEEKFCCHSAQNIATNGTGIRTFRRILPVSLLKISRAYFLAPTGGIWTNFLRPIQKMTVATAMKIPGSPKAMSGLWRRGLSRKLTIEGDKLATNPPGSALYGSSSHGIRRVDNADPALIEK